MGFIATAIAVAGAASAGASIYNAKSAQSSNKNAAQAAEQQNNAAIQAVKDSQANSSTQAANKVKAIKSSASQTVYTSPLGLAGDANTIKKTLLGE